MQTFKLGYIFMIHHFTISSVNDIKIHLKVGYVKTVACTSLYRIGIDANDVIRGSFRAGEVEPLFGQNTPYRRTQRSQGGT